MLTGNITVRNYYTDIDDNVLPQLSKLSVYPNPFNPETQIAFFLGKIDKVRVEVYNIKGQYVATLHDGFMKPGRQTLSWKGKNANGVNVGSGIYFAKIEAGNKSQIIKMMLLK